MEGVSVWTVIRYRPLQALVVCALSALVTACAVFAPLYDRALQQATVQTRLHDTPVQVQGLRVASTAGPGTPALGPGDLDGLVPDRLRRFFHPPVAGLTVHTDVAQTPSGSSAAGPLLWRAGQCRHLLLDPGRCPSRVDEVAVSRADARHFGWRIGSQVPLQEALSDDLVPASGHVPHARMTVVGLYTVRPGSYWFGNAPVGRSGTVQSDSANPQATEPQVDGFVTTRGTVDGDGVHWRGTTAEADLRLDASRVGIDEILRIGPAVSRFTTVPDPRAGLLYDVPPEVDAYSGLPDVAADARHGREQARVTVPLLMAQLGLLAVVVLWLVLGAATEQRRPEVAVARLRGRGVAGARRLLLGELGVVVLAGVPCGLALALGLSWLARHVFLPLTPPFELGKGFGWALGGVVVLLAVVVAVAVHLVAREPIAGLLRRVPARRTTWAVGAVDAMLVATCATAVAAFATGGLQGPIALAAPALLALLVGLVLAHLLVPVAASAGRRLLARGRLTAGVSALHVARRPATRRVVTIVTVATALLVFSADALAVGYRNRTDTAAQEVGAPLVATLSGGDVVGVRDALRDVDPHGRAATPVVTVSPPGQDGTTVQAVLPAAFAHVALLPGQSAADVPWGRLRPPTVRPVRLVGTTVSVVVSSTLRRTTGAGPAAVRLYLRLVDADRQAQQVTLTTLAPGRHAVTAAVPCRGGCDLAAIVLDAAAPVAGTVRLSGATTSGRRPLQLGPAGHWQPTPRQPAGSITPLVTGRTDRLAVRFTAAGSGAVTMLHGSLPQRIPALVTGTLPPGAVAGRFNGPGLDGVDRAMVRVAALPRVPAAPAHAALVNLDVLQRDGTSAEPGAVISVFFAHDDRPLLAKVTRALRARGIEVTTTSTAAGARRVLDHSAAAWSLSLGAVVGLAALLLAALVLTVVGATTWRLRTRDFAALRMSGLSRGHISVVAAGEQVPVVALAVVAGAVCGAAGAHVALSTVPLFAHAPSVSTLDLSTSWTAVCITAVVALAVLSLVGWTVAWSIAGRADLGRLRESL